MENISMGSPGEKETGDTKLERLAEGCLLMTYFQRYMRMALYCVCYISISSTSLFGQMMVPFERCVLAGY